MAKKLGRPRKKRKYTRRKPAYQSLGKAMKNVKNGDTIFVNPPATNSPIKNMREQAQEPHRASENSYFFLDGCKVLVRNMADVKLIEEHAKVYNRAQEVRRSLEFLESLQFNMSMEQRFRGLK